MAALFPEPTLGLTYLTEGGPETEISYEHGFDLPHFVMFGLLDDDRAVAVLRGMYERYLDVAVRHGFGVLMAGVDYRASPDWAALLGFSSRQLADLQLRAIDFLREVAEPRRAEVPALLYAGVVGPRFDAYDPARQITAVESQAYHSEQIATLARAGVDLVQTLTLSSIPEAVGVCRAAARAGLPVSVSFTLDNTTHRLSSGPSLRDAVETVDLETGPDRPAFYGVNCSHPLEFIPAVEPGGWFRRVRSLRPNAALLDKIELSSLGHLERGNPTQLGELMGDLAKRHPHIDIWGGCCGTWDTHLEEIAARVGPAREAGVPGSHS
ncbi:homocysteine S-methyltransferase family protein [Williamsia herbipolensis]|uniref:Homocysteine S-methyltransferase family protein n=1 Tax=Williamsia herbipolensis TaxID=1603258 RepID=A0AAU4K5S6_9NOCA|nr:homocysteine S-methyltransferase family protein [Williamsia herbipolensis]